MPSFPFAGFGNDTQRHAIQILAAVGASSAYATPGNFFSYIPPLPPAPPPFPLVPNTFPSQVSSSTSGRLSPSMKRPIDENSNHNLHSDEDPKRRRFDSIPRSRNFDEENIAPVPSLIDANINTLKKYLNIFKINFLFNLIFFSKENILVLFNNYILVNINVVYVVFVFQLNKNIHIHIILIGIIGKIVKQQHHLHY
jgi:hypothetical protein